jgi:hypothetical protein
MKIIVKCPKCEQKLRVTFENNDRQPDFSAKTVEVFTTVREPFKWPEKEWDSLWESFNKFTKKLFGNA